MHEMAVAQGLIEIIGQEMERHGASRLIAVRVRHGALAGIVPQALEFAWQAMTNGTNLEGARLDLVLSPLRLACFTCKHEFTPEDPGPRSSGLAVIAPCPACGEELGHTILSGRELHLEHLEAE